MQRLTFPVRPFRIVGNLELIAEALINAVTVHIDTGTNNAAGLLFGALTIS